MSHVALLALPSCVSWRKTAPPSDILSTAKLIRTYNCQKGTEARYIAMELLAMPARCEQSAADCGMADLLTKQVQPTQNWLEIDSDRGLALGERNETT